MCVSLPINRLRLSMLAIIVWLYRIANWRRGSNGGVECLVEFARLTMIDGVAIQTILIVVVVAAAIAAATCAGSAA